MLVFLGKSTANLYPKIFYSHELPKDNRKKKTGFHIFWISLNTTTTVQTDNLPWFSWKLTTMQKPQNIKGSFQNLNLIRKTNHEIYHRIHTQLYCNWRFFFYLLILKLLKTKKDFVISFQSDNKQQLHSLQLIPDSNQLHEPQYQVRP